MALVSVSEKLGNDLECSNEPAWQSSNIFLMKSGKSGCAMTPSTNDAKVCAGRDWEGGEDMSSVLGRPG